MAWTHAMRERLSALLRPRSRDRELDEEIRFHLERETDRLVANGHDVASARELARRRFGDPDRVAEAAREARGEGLLAGAGQDLRWAARSLRREPRFTLLAIATLGLGVGAAVAAFTLLDGVLLRPLAFDRPEQLVLMREVTARHQLRPPSYPNFEDWRSHSRSLAAVVAAQLPQSSTVTVHDEPIRASLLGVSRGFFATLGATPVAGRGFTDEESRLGGPCVVMVSHAFWSGPMGARLPLGALHFGAESCDVVGVLPARFRFLAEHDVYYPLEQGPGTVRSAHNYWVVGRLAPAVSLAAARADLTALARKMKSDYGDATEAVDVDLTQLREYVIGDFRLLLVVVFGAAALVLLVACTNLASAQLARGMRRLREIAVRASLGAGRLRLVRQLLLENAILAGGGALLGLGLAYLLTASAARFGRGLVPRLDEATIDGRVLLFAVAVGGLTVLVVGLYPALRASAHDPAGALHGAPRVGGDAIRGGAWRALIGFEVGMAVVLVVGSGLLARTFAGILGSDPGFEPRGLISIELSPSGHEPAEFARLRDRLAALPGVDGVAYSTAQPLEWGAYSAPVIRPGDSPEHDYPALAGFRVVTDDYFSVLRQRIERGRAFEPADRAGAPPVAIVTPGIAAALWPGQDPVGKKVASNFTGALWYTVVGVAAEASNWRSARGGQNEIYVPIAQQSQEVRSRLVAFVRVRGDAEVALGGLRAHWKELAPGMPARLDTILGRIGDSAADRRLAMLSLVAFAVVALALAAIGIYAVMSYTVASRRLEIGVRLALGATPRGVRAEVLRGAASIAGVGIVAGSIASAVLSRYLESLLYGVGRFDLVSYLIGAVCLLLAALGGAFAPAARSSRVDPAVTLRADA